MLPAAGPERVGFSGSSGGALVAAALASGVRVAALAEFVLGCRDECRAAPSRMLPCVERALDALLPADAHERCSGRLRVLLTRVVASNPPLFCAGEVASDFDSREHLWQLARETRASLSPALARASPRASEVLPTPSSLARGTQLRASCHMPIVAGARPYRVRGAAYFDGLFWR